MKNIETMQKQHFDSISERYAAHYGDEWSQRYRHKFINDNMLGDIDLKGLKVLDAMCGSGETAQYLLSKGAKVTALDISEEEIKTFRENFPECEGCCGSIFSTNFPDESFDVVVVVGGLHHLQPDVALAMEEMYRILKPKGYFCFMEPHAGSLPDIARQIWYKFDRIFAENEAAVDLVKLKEQFASRFEFLKEDYGGNLAFLLVFNSMIFRVPLHWKKLYSQSFIAIESALKTLQGKLLSCFVVCRWRKI